MKNSLILGSALVFVLVSGLPVIKERPKENVVEEKPPVGEVETLEYERYLREVVDALESDPDFRKKLDKAPEADIRTGKIAQELEYVSHHIRSKLDEIKRREIERLRSLLKKEYELRNDIDREHMKIDSHLNSDNIHTFEIEDLKKLILKTTHDLVEADKKRREEFKQYELQKEFEKQQVLHELDEEQRKKYEAELKEKEEKHNKHEKLHHPGNKAQLEEVWEKQDHMDGLQFDPRQFFSIHDLDGNGYWDETELKALFVKELDKVYQEGMPEDDLRERAEEMERMREHVMTEWDTNKDGLISFGEFAEQTKKEEFERDPGWDTVDNQPQFTHEEYLEFERKRQEEIQKLIAQGALPPHPNMPQGYYPHEVHPNQHPNAAQVNYHPNQQYQVQQPHQQPPQYQHQPQYQPPPQYQQQQQHQVPVQQQQQQPQYQQQQHQVPVQQQQHQPQYQQQQNVQQQQQYQPPPPQYNQQQQNVPPPQYQQQGQPTNNQHPPAQQAPANPQQPMPKSAQNVPAPNPVPNQQAPTGNNQQAPSGANPANVPNNIPPPVKTIDSNAIH